MSQKEVEILEYAPREQRGSKITYRLLSFLGPIIFVILLMAAEGIYVSARPVTLPPLPLGIRWLIGIQVAVLCASLLMNLILIPWHLRYLRSYQRSTYVKKLVFIGLFSFVVLAVNLFLLYMIALVNAV